MSKIYFIIHFFFKILHFKKSCNLISWLHFGPKLKNQNLPDVGKMNFHGKKGLCQFLNILTIHHRAKNQESNNESFLRKKYRTDGWIDNSDFIGPSVGRGFNNNSNNDSNNNSNSNNSKLFFTLFTEVNVGELLGKK